MEKKLEKEANHQNNSLHTRVFFLNEQEPSEVEFHGEGTRCYLLTSMVFPRGIIA